MTVWRFVVSTFRGRSSRQRESRKGSHWAYEKWICYPQRGQRRSTSDELAVIASQTARASGVAQPRECVGVYARGGRCLACGMGSGSKVEAGVRPKSWKSCGGAGSALWWCSLKAKQEPWVEPTGYSSVHYPQEYPQTAVTCDRA